MIDEVRLFATATGILKSKWQFPKTPHKTTILSSDFIIVKTFEKVNNIKVNYKFAPRRKGDIAICLADPSKAEKELNFKATKTLEEMCKDAYNYAMKNR